VVPSSRELRLGRVLAILVAELCDTETEIDRARHDPRLRLRLAGLSAAIPAAQIARDTHRDQ
jgi:hypothetical protein